MKPICSVLVALMVTFVLGAPSAFAGSEKDIPLSKVPKKVLAAAEKAVPGIKFTEAEVKKTKKGLEYEIEGMADGKKYEIRVLEDGKVLGVKEGDDDDKDDDDDDTDAKKPNN